MIAKSCLLVLQSKRLMLQSLERRLADAGGDRLRQRADEARAAVVVAEASYRSSVLAYTSPGAPDFWIMAYARLLVSGHALASRFRQVHVNMPARDQAELASDASRLEEILDAWRRAMQSAQAVA